ncbi:MAG: AI-2E family transporter [Vicinamibacterales bacterium]|jgi:predicted PurR-regulated permease PerM|nr:AI-2E family transporter [Vicinamibacterales bacterium]
MEKRPDRGARFLVVAASVIVIIAGLQAASQLLLPFLTAVFLAVISLPIMVWLQRKKVPTPLAVLSTVAAAAGVVSVLGVVVGQSVNEFAQVAPQYQVRIQQLATGLLAWAEGLGLPTSESTLLDYVNPEAVVDLLVNLLGGTLGALTALLSNAFLVLLAVIFILFEAAGFRAKLRIAFGERGDNLDRFSQMTLQIQNYLAIKTMVSLGTGLLAGLWVWGLGVDFPLLWGLVAFVFNYIPNLGSIFAAIGPVLLSVVQFGPGRTIAVAAGYVVINVIFGNVVEPMLLGRRLGLSTLVVFMSLVFWGWVWGPMGMLLSVPLTMMLKIALENTEDLRWVAVMLDKNPSLSAAAETIPASSPAAPSAPPDAPRAPQAPTRNPAA